MDIEGSTFTTADLLSLRYPLTSNGTPCSSGSLLLSSPWPISSTPSPPSSTSSASPSSVATISEGTLLSISTSSPSSACSPPSSVPTASSPVPSELSLGTGGGAVVCTSSPSRCAPPSLHSGALALGDPVSTHTFEVAHAPGKSILCVHEQDHGDLVHFSHSNINRQHNHVNGNGNEDYSEGNRSSSTSTSICNLMGADDKDFITVQSSLLHSDNAPSATLSLPMSTPSSTSNTDGNLFPTLILTSAGASNDPGEHVIPMRLYASLTSSSIPPNGSNDHCPTSLNGSILTTAGDGESGTCILMTPMTSHEQLPSSTNELQHQLHQHHHVLISSNENDNDHNGPTFTLSGFGHHETSTNHESTDLQTTTLGGSSILMDDCYEKNPHHTDITFAKLSTASSPSIDSYSSHGKLKDILMNGNSHQHQNHHSQHSTALISNSSTNEDTYMLRDLEATPNSSVSGGTFFIPKEEDDNALVEELKLHSVAASEEQNSFNEAINSIYHSSSTSRNPFCDASSPDGVNGDLIMVTGDGQHDQLEIGSYGGSTGVISAVGSASGLITISSSSFSALTGTPSVIWSNSGGVVSSVSSSIPPHMMHHPLILKEEDLGDLDGIEDDDLLEAKEEMDDMDFGEFGEGDGQGGKGELKCKFCGFVCCSKSSLGIHERRHTGERPFACKYCGRLFNSAQCCKHHERLHTGDKPFQCSYCGKKYAVSTRLKRHERVHTREEPYKCTECNKTFRWFDAFRDHRNTHTGVPLYLCSVCGKTFTSYLKFYYHERGHLMKKERDRDRLAKQRLLSGVDCSSHATWAFHISKGIIPISTTIDILKSLQRNSSAGIISSLSAASNIVGNPVGKKVSTATGAKGNAKKGASKGKKGMSSIQFQ